MGAIKRLFVEESGQGLAEYGLIMALVALAVVIALTTLAGGLNDIFGNINSKVENAPTGS